MLETAVVGGALLAGVAVAGVAGSVLSLACCARKPKVADEEAGSNDSTNLADVETSMVFRPYRLRRSTQVDFTKDKASWDLFAQLIVSENSALTAAILRSIKATQLDPVSVDLVCLHHLSGSSQRFVVALMEQEMKEFEVGATRVPSENGKALQANAMPFRQDSAATKAFKVYSRLIGLDYLQRTLHDAVKEMCAAEADPNVAPVDSGFGSDSVTASGTLVRPASGNIVNNSSSSDFDTLLENINSQSLQASCHAIFKSITSSAEKIPAELRAIFAAVQAEATKCTSLASVNELALTSNLFFLRFVNPAILMPHVYGVVEGAHITFSVVVLRLFCGCFWLLLVILWLFLVFLALFGALFAPFLVLFPPFSAPFPPFSTLLLTLCLEEPKPHIKPRLLFVAKMLQGLAFGVEFGKKEDYMANLNPFIQEHLKQMQEFLRDISAAGGTDTPAAPVPETVHSAALGRLYATVYGRWDAIGAIIERDSPAVAQVRNFPFFVQSSSHFYSFRM